MPRKRTGFHLGRQTPAAQRMRRNRQNDQSMSNETLHHVSWENAAFSYDHTKPYASHVNVSIGQMIAVCEHCQSWQSS